MVEAELTVDDTDKPEVVADLEEPIEEAPHVDLEPTPEDKPKVHPLAPGGKRFEQVYAESKRHQREAEELRNKLAALEAERTQQPEEYTREQLAQAVALGTITQTQADKQIDEQNKRKIKAELKHDLEKESAEATREMALSRGIYAYVQAEPALQIPGSKVRLDVDNEFDWLVSVRGLDVTKITKSERKVLELTALRTVLGDAEKLKKRTATPHADLSEETPGGTPPSNPTNPDQKILDSLTKTEVAHYKKAMAAGRYPGKWKEVVEEIKFRNERRAAGK